MTGVGRYRPAWAEVDLEALRHNVRFIIDRVAPAEVCAVVKADGYGHGAVEVSLAALEAGARSLAVALVEEGVALRDAGIDAPILLLSEPTADAAAEVVARRLTPTLYSADGVDAFGTAADSATPLGVHLKVDTGMHRVGADPTTAVGLARLIHEHPSLHLDAVWTHFAVADDATQHDFTGAQVAKFEQTCAAIEAAGVPVPKRHTSNAAGALYEGQRHDLVRPGIAVYGYAPDPTRPLDLRPVLSLRARVTHVQVLEAGERLSYGLRHALGTRSTIATVPLGYADGVPRRLSGQGAEVLLRGVRRTVVGTITMDQLLVDCGPDAQVSVGDDVVLLGRQGEEVITAEDWAARVGTISYEILCGIGPRVPRTYLR